MTTPQSDSPRRHDYTQAEFLSNPQLVLNQVEETGTPAAIHRHGLYRFEIRRLNDHQMITDKLTKGPLANQLLAQAKEETAIDEVRPIEKDPDE
jgi:hypothetical protein